MPCTTNTTIVQIAVRTLIKELVAMHAARRRARRAPAECQPCATRATRRAVG